MSDERDEKPLPDALIFTDEDVAASSSDHSDDEDDHEVLFGSDRDASSSWWAIDSDDEDDASQWTYAERVWNAMGQVSQRPPPSLFGAFDLLSRRKDADRCYPWRRAASSSGKGKRAQALQAATKAVRSALDEDAALLLELVTMAREWTSMSARQLAVDTTALKLARLRERRHAARRSLFQARAALKLDKTPSLLRGLPNLRAEQSSDAPAAPAAAPAAATVVQQTKAPKGSAKSVPSSIRNTLTFFNRYLDAVSLATLSGCCRALRAACRLDRQWKRLVVQRFGSKLAAIDIYPSQFALYGALARHSARRRARLAADDASMRELSSLGVPDDATGVHAIAVGGARRSAKRRAVSLMAQAREARSAGSEIYHYGITDGKQRIRIDLLGIGQRLLFPSTESWRSLVPLSALVFVCDNRAASYLNAREPVRLYEQLARARGAQLLLVLCLCWRGDDAFEPERVAQELCTPLLASDTLALRGARLQAVEPHSGVGIDEAMEWLDEKLLKLQR